MTSGAPKNMAASVHQRLLNEARKTGRPFNELLQYFAMERFLYRLAVSPYAGNFLQFDFDGATLADAIRATFDQRQTQVPADTIAFSTVFASSSGRSRQWESFVRKLPMNAAPADLGQVVSAIAAFLQPVASALHSGHTFRQTWTAPGPWKS